MLGPELVSLGKRGGRGATLTLEVHMSHPVVCVMWSDMPKPGPYINSMYLSVYLSLSLYISLLTSIFTGYTFCKPATSLKFTIPQSENNLFDIFEVLKAGPYSFRISIGPAARLSPTWSLRVSLCLVEAGALAVICRCKLIPCWVWQWNVWEPQEIEIWTCGGLRN